MGRKLQKFLLQFNYNVINNEPTRVTKSSSTLIDLVIASRVELIKKTLPLEVGISDHKLADKGQETPSETCSRPHLQKV